MVPASSGKRDAIADLEAENARLRAELDLARNRSLESWLAAMQRSGVAVRDFETSLSWRVTRPLRSLRRVQVAIGDIGLGGVVSTAVRRLRARRRTR